MLAGFAGGGLLVAAITPNGALALDALSFAVSALILSAGLHARPAAMAEAQSTSLLGDAVAGLRVVAADRRRFGPLLLGIAGAAYIVVPEGIATAYAHLLGFGAAVVGLLMAAVALGHVVGAVLVGRLMTEPLRRALMWPMALAGTVPLMACLTRPGLAGTLVLFALAGAVQCVPGHRQHDVRSGGAARGARPGVRAGDDLHVRRAVSGRRRGRRRGDAVVGQRGRGRRGRAGRRRHRAAPPGRRTGPDPRPPHPPGAERR